MTQKYVNGELVNLTSEEETQISNDISKNDNRKCCDWIYNE